MAETAIRTITMEEYLNGPVPSPDGEYVDGLLREKSVVKRIHTRLQSIICSWFEVRTEQWKVVPSPELRTQVSPDRVRLPDVVVSDIGYPHEVQLDPPLIVIEILSPTDGFAELLEKVRDYREMGVANIWVIDPQTRRGWVGVAAGLIETARFAVEGTEIYLDLAETFARYDRFR